MRYSSSKCVVYSLRWALIASDTSWRSSGWTIFAQSAVTHGHFRSQLCCALYCLWARRIGEGATAAEGWDQAVAGLKRMLTDRWARYELEDRVLVDGVPRGSGYVVDALRSARSAVDRGAVDDSWPGYEAA